MGELSFNAQFVDESDWGCFPEEIKLIIFNYLDAESLGKCLFVNNSWRHLVKRTAKRRNMWRQIFEIMVLDKGVTIRRKANNALNWEDLCMNYLQWQNVHDAKFELLQIIETLVQAVQIFKDYDYQETVYMTLVADIDREKRITLFLYGKDVNFGPKQYHRNFETLTFGDVVLYRLEDNTCYAIDSKNTLWRVTWTDALWIRHVCAVYFGTKGSIRAINVHRNEIYILIVTGDIYRYNASKMMFEKVFSLKIPSIDSESNPVMFGKFSVVMAVASYKEFKMIRHEPAEHLVLECPGLTCATSHGDVLFLGYEDGKVEILLLKDLSTKTKVIELHLRDLQTGNSDIPKTIKAINVHEAKTAQHLFIGTTYKVYHVLITYPERNYDGDDQIVISQRSLIF